MSADRAKTDLEKASRRLLHLLSFVPEDKLNWKPSPSAGSALRIVSHCTASNRFFADTIAGRHPETMPTPEEFFAALSEASDRPTTREEAIDRFEASVADLNLALDSVEGERLESSPASPFGPLPMRFWMEQGGEHTAQHAAQLAYLQTVWGDLDNHFA